MTLTLSLADDRGRHVAALNVPITQQAFLTETDEALLVLYFLPYLTGFRRDAFLFMGTSRSGPISNAALDGVPV